MSRRPATRATVSAVPLVLFVLGAAVFADRTVIGVASGGRGALPLLGLVAPIVAIAAVARFGRQRSLGFVSHPVFLFGVLPYVALSGLLPILGVMINRYPERTLLSITEATSALSFLVIGSALSADRRDSWSPWLLLAIALQLGYAAGQAIYLVGGPGAELFAPFAAWDRSVGALQGQFITARSSGLYVNPNELGLWAGIAAILAWTLLPARLRGVGLTLAVLTLLLSQSRGATVALVAALGVAVVLAVLRGRIVSSGTSRAVVSIGLAGLLAIGVAFAVVPSGALAERFGAIARVLAEGPTADPNLAGRLDYWSAVTTLNSVYPWGTLGSPELILGTSVDSTWFRAFGQGSVLYVATLGLLLVGSLFVGGSRYGQALRLVTVMVAIAGVTMNPFGYPMVVLFWTLLGATLRSAVVARVATRPEPIRPTGTRGPSPAGAGRWRP